jgi:putative acetyltransferase
VIVRRETAADVAAVAEIHALAFARSEGEGGPPVEVALLEALRASPAWVPQLSLVAVDDDIVVGHVVCTRATVGRDGAPAVGLGPIGVHPERQRTGTGKALMHAVLGAADALDVPLVGLLGDPAYYGRFGFVASTDHGIEPPDPKWGVFFQVRTLAAHTADIGGLFRYAPPFDAF